MNIAVFASHNGSDLQAIIDACKNGTVHARVGLVISNNGDALALKRAEEADIPAVHLSVKITGSDEALDEKMLEILKAHEIELVFLAGYLKKIGLRVLTAYDKRIFNIHPALLPKYGGTGMYGMNVHRAVIEAGERVSGITIHRVSADYDEGEIIAQREVPVLENDTPEILALRILKEEHRFLVEVLETLVAESNDIVNFKNKAAKISELFEYNRAAKINDHIFTIIKAKNRVPDFHTHNDSDEAFYVIEGFMKVELRNKIITLYEGDMFVVPKGIEHRPVCIEPVTCLLIEKEGTLTPKNAPGTHK